ncbi:MAG: TlpA disulfide reductase family protein, partial [Planctomycetota bacterium]
MSSAQPAATPPKTIADIKPPLSDLVIQPPDISLEDRALLVCFWDMDSRPSRRAVEELTARYRELRGCGVTVLPVHAGGTDASSARAWLAAKRFPPLWAFIRGDRDETLARWGAESLPWLVLVDKEHIVRAAGFGISDLDQTMRERFGAAILEVRALDAKTGEPVEGVTAWFLPPDARLHRFSLSCKTDENGSVRLVVWPESYVLKKAVKRPDYEDLKSDEIIELKEGAVGRFEMRLRPFEKTAGVVRDASGRPVSGALVGVWPSGRRPW